MLFVLHLCVYLVCYLVRFVLEDCSFWQVLECHVVVDPRTRESRGFGFVTMETMKDADRCVKYLDRSVLEGRLIKVEKVHTSFHILDVYR